MIKINKSRISNQKLGTLFQYNLIPLFIWQIINDDLVIIEYNIDTEKITKGLIKNFSGDQVSVIKLGDRYFK